MNTMPIVPGTNTTTLTYQIDDNGEIIGLS